MTAKAVTDATFDLEVLESDKPVVVDFWAPWCGPCRQVSPILDEIASQHSSKLSVVKVNADENPRVVSRYGVISLPTLAVYTNGEMVKAIVGARSKPALIKELSDWIA